MSMIYGHLNSAIINSWNFYQEETFEEKLNRMKLDKFKKDYPMFSNIDYITRIVKSKIKIYSEDIMRGVFIDKASL